MAAVAGVLAGVLAGLMTTSTVGLIIGSATGIALLVPRLRVLLGLAAVACVVAAGCYVAVHQNQVQVPDNGAWPQSFAVASQWVWAAVVFLGADGIVDAVLRTRSARKDRIDRGASSGESYGSGEVLDRAAPESTTPTNP